MSDQREMTLDEYLESKLPDFHLARRQLQELREERDALAAHVAACHALMGEMPRRSLAWQVNAIVDLKAEAPEAGLAKLIAEKQADILEQMLGVNDAGIERMMLELRRQAEEGNHD